MKKVKYWKTELWRAHKEADAPRSTILAHSLLMVTVIWVGYTLFWVSTQGKTSNFPLATLIVSGCTIGLMMLIGSILWVVDIHQPGNAHLRIRELAWEMGITHSEKIDEFAQQRLQSVYCSVDLTLRNHAMDIQMLEDAWKSDKENVKNLQLRIQFDAVVTEKKEELRARMRRLFDLIQDFGFVSVGGLGQFFPPKRS